MNENARGVHQKVFYGLLLLFVLFPIFGFGIFYINISKAVYAENPAIIILKSPEFFWVYFTSFSWLYCTLSIPLCWAYYEEFVKEPIAQTPVNLSKNR